MNGQFLCNRQITVSYAYKKDTKGERHGTPAGRISAASNPNAQKSRPHTLFASGPPTLPSSPQANGAARPPPFANGAVPSGRMAVVRPPTPQSVPFSPMQLTGQAPWQGQTIPPPVMPAPMQFRPPPSNIPPPPPPPPQSAISRPLPTMRMGGALPPFWPSAPPPQQVGGMPPMPQMSMLPPPPPPSTT